MTADNPAMRLLELLTSLKAQPSSLNLGNTLRQMWELPPDASHAELMHYLAVAASWPDAAKREVEELTDVNHERLLSWYPNIANAMVQLGNVSTSVEGVKPFYNDVDLNNLAHTADTLHYKCPEPTIPDDKLAGLVDMVREVIDAVTADEGLPTRVRAELIKRLREVEQALIHFRLVGYEGVQNAMDQFLGTVARYPEAHQNGKSWAARIWGGIMGALTGAKQIAEAGTAVAGAIEAFKPMIGQ